MKRIEIYRNIHCFSILNTEPQTVVDWDFWKNRMKSQAPVRKKNTTKPQYCSSDPRSVNNKSHYTKQDQHMADTHITQTELFRTVLQNPTTKCLDCPFNRSTPVSAERSEQLHWDQEEKQKTTEVQVVKLSVNACKNPINPNRQTQFIHRGKKNNQHL